MRAFFAHYSNDDRFGELIPNGSKVFCADSKGSYKVFSVLPLDKISTGAMETVISDQWSVVSGQWSVVSGQWSVVSGQGSVVSGQWSVVSGQWSVVSPMPNRCHGIPRLIRNRELAYA